MTTYYAKPFEGIMTEVYDTNPALYTGFASVAGKVPLAVADPWNEDYFHFNSVLKATKARFANEPGWDAIPESKLDPGFVKAKWFYWNDEVSEKEYMSLKQNPNGMIAQQIKSRVKAQQEYFVSQVDDYLVGFNYSSSSADYDEEWRPLLKNKAATGTVSDPQDLNSTPGTTTATGIKMTGAAQVVDAYNKAIGLIKERFFQQYDSNTKQAMYLQSNSFDLFLHPAVIEKLRKGHEVNSNGFYDYSRSYLDLCALDSVNVVPTFAVDAAYNAASGTVAEGVLTMNTKQNFLINEIVPYTIEPYQYNPVKNNYRMRAYWKILPMVKPYYLDSVYKKAMTSFSFIPYAES